MSGRFAAVAPVQHIEHQLTWISAHLERLARGHDPYGHLLAIARAARAEWTHCLMRRRRDNATDGTDRAPLRQRMERLDGLDEAALLGGS